MRKLNSKYGTYSVNEDGSDTKKQLRILLEKMGLRCIIFKKDHLERYNKLRSD